MGRSPHEASPGRDHRGYTDVTVRIAPASPVSRALTAAALVAASLTAAGLVAGPVAGSDVAAVVPAVPVVAAGAAPTELPVEVAPPVPAVPQVGVGRSVVFLADYETGDLSQWGTCQSALVNGSCDDLGGGDRAMRVVEAQAPDGGRYAARFIVRNGDIPEFGGGERSEVSENEAGAETREGDERWYEWSMRLPADFTNPTGGWFIVMQWHAGDGSPPLAIDISRNGTVDIGGDGSGEPRRTIGPVRPGEWVTYVLHVGFSRDSDTGFVEAWENGELRVPKTYRATMSSSENYLKQGIYRDEEAGDGPTEVQFAGLRVTAP